MRFLFSPYGRTDRKGIWFFVALYLALTFGSAEADKFLGTYSVEMATGAIETLMGLFLLWPSIAVPVRRLHDLGYSGWWVLWVSIIAVVMMVVVIVAGAFAGADLGFIATMDQAAPTAIKYSDLSWVFWAAIAAGATPLLVQYFMLGFLPGQEGENRFDRAARSKPTPTEPPPWKD